jgi:hypothetical protein
VSGAFGLYPASLNDRLYVVIHPKALSLTMQRSGVESRTEFEGTLRNMLHYTLGTQRVLFPGLKDYENLMACTPYAFINKQQSPSNARTSFFVVPMDALFMVLEQRKLESGAMVDATLQSRPEYGVLDHEFCPFVFYAKSSDGVTVWLEGCRAGGRVVESQPYEFLKHRPVLGVPLTKELYKSACMKRFLELASRYTDFHRYGPATGRVKGFATLLSEVLREKRKRKVAATGGGVSKRLRRSCR